MRDLKSVCRAEWHGHWHRGVMNRAVMQSHKYQNLYNKENERLDDAMLM